MPVPRASSPFVRAGTVAALVAGLWWSTVHPVAMPPVWPMGSQPVYSGLDAPALVWLEPVLHAAWLDPPAAPLGLLAAGLVILGASGVAIFAGASGLASVGVLAALVLDSSFSAALAHGAGLVMAVGLVWLAAGAAFDSHSRLFDGRPWFNPLSAMLLWALAVWWDWMAVIAWPLVWASFRRTPERPGRGWWTVASLVVGAVTFIGHFAWMADAAGRLNSAPVTWTEAMAVAFHARAAMPPGSFAAPELTSRLGYLLMALAAAGLLFGSLGRWWRPTVLLSAGLALAVGLVWSEWRGEVFRFALWALAPLSAVGLTWVAGQGRRPVVVTIVLAAIAVTETVVMGARPLQGADPRRFRDVLTDALVQRAHEAPLVIVAEDTRIDSALVPWMAGRPDVRRAAQDGQAVRRAREEGRVVLAGPVGRRHLQLAGVSFADAVTISDPAPFVLSEVDGTFRCVAVRADRWSQLPGLEYTGRLGIEMPGRFGGELHLVVGDALPLPLHAESPDGRPLSLRMEALLSGPGAAAPPADYWIDGGRPDDTPWVRRLQLIADPVAPTLLSLDFGRRAPRVIARLANYGGDARGRVCAAPVGPVRLRSPGETPLPLGDEDLFGTGWYGREGRGPDAFRWADLDAVVLVRSAVQAQVEVALEARPAVGSHAGTTAADDTTVMLRVNGIDVGTRTMQDTGARYTWRVPAGAWVAGTNELWWRTSRAVRPADGGGADTRSLALRVTGLSVTRQ